MILINRLTIRTGSCFKGARYRFIKVCRKMNGIRISIIGFGKRHGRRCSVNDGQWAVCRIVLRCCGIFRHVISLQSDLAVLLKIYGQCVAQNRRLRIGILLSSIHRIAVPV